MRVIDTSAEMLSAFFGDWVSFDNVILYGIEEVKDGFEKYYKIQGE